MMTVKEALETLRQRQFIQPSEKDTKLGRWTDFGKEWLKMDPQGFLWDVNEIVGVFVYPLEDFCTVSTLRHIDVYSAQGYVPLKCVELIDSPDRVKVLDRGWVELQDVMGDDLAIVNGARTSFLGESKGEDQDKKLLFYLMEHRHDSPFELVEFKFRIHAPELVWRQLLRHRTGNFNLQSGRYTEYLENEFYLPEHWRGQSSVNKQGSDGLLSQEDSDELNRLLQMHYDTSYLFYEKAISKGAAREIARLFLPGFGVYSTGIVKFDARNLMHFLSLRTAPDAQEEIRQYANVMWDMFEEHLPWCAEAFKKYKRGRG